MKTLLSKTRINRIREQGYVKQTDAEISSLAWGNRFAYILCTLLLGLGITFANIPLLGAMLVVAIGGFILPYHPFDYIYNRLLAKPPHLPKLPRRSEQLKFACLLASIWIATDIYLFSSGFIMAGYILGSSLFVVAFTVSFFDFCLPSVIYNSLFLDRPRNSINHH